MPDIYALDIVDALDHPGCCLCHVSLLDDRRWMETFRREGRRDPETRRRFYAAGGFCPRHAWLFHELVGARRSGAEIADVYGSLVEHDLELLAKIPVDRRRRRRRQSLLGRSEKCPACSANAEASDRRAFFLCRALNEASARDTYAKSDGLCFGHLSAVIERGYARNDVYCVLLHCWRTQLTSVRAALADFDRKRDHRFAAEPRGEEQHSWTDVIWRYAGNAPER